MKNFIQQKYWIMAVFISMTFSLQGQSGLNNPLGNAIIQNESNPIDLATGLPYITVPLFKMPTLADDINVNMALGYHPPSSVATNGLYSGNCGRAWTLSTGGAIVGEHSVERADWQSTINSTSRAYFNYSFMGYSGKFYVIKEGGLLNAYIAEKNSNHLSIEIGHHATTYQITSINLYDHNGYKYTFDVVDSYKKGSIFENYMFQLSTIKDNNNATLATFIYRTHANTSETHKIVETITTHHGKVEFENSLGTSTGYDSSVCYTKMTVSDFKNNFIRRFDFTYNDSSKLIQLDESDLLQTGLLSHKFYYKTNLLFAGQGYGTDEWGYQNLNNSLCNNLTNVTPHTITDNLLQKISLPSGGAIVYEYESNTFSYSMNKPLDVNNNGILWVTNPQYFTTLNYKNLHNFQKAVIVSGSFTTGSSVSFTLTATKKVYIKLNGMSYTSPLDAGGAPVTIFPQFTLRKNGVVLLANMGNSICSNDGMGSSMNLDAGNYSITMTASKPTSGSVNIDSYTAVSSPKKWHYGNGIRIKRIGYFDTDVVSQKYYELSTSPTILPVKEINYDYNLQENPSRSSGCVYYVNAYTEEKPTVIYKNVTVTESGNVGKTVNTFYSPLDYYQLAYFDGQEPNFSKIKEVKVYDQGGTLVQQKNFTFTSTTVGTHNTDPRFQLDFQLSSTLPAEVIQKDYLNTIVETRTTFDYDSYRKLTNSKQFTNTTGDFILKKYFYHWLNSATSKNRRVLEKIETYRNSDLLFTDLINYGKTWATITEPGQRPLTYLTPYPNVSYLPLSQQGSKGNEGLFTGQRFNLYDGYSRLWESETDNGIKTVYIWGYNHTQIVAKIDNIAYGNIPQTLIHAIVRASDTGTEASLITAQNNLRANANLVNAMITTYTYKPLIGISTVTDEKKQTIQYFYDVNNRLKQVKDANGKILTENEYNYRTQN